ncbi:hypothetical protein OIE50_48985 [Streptomyces canus]|uniref:hypothetical protein n=1 Tax=Streptomyces canus TaxID=58343 RepID=UPI00324E0D16
MSRRRLLAISAAVLSALTGTLDTAVAHADTGTALYVDDDAVGCSDTGPGSQAVPFCQIQPAADAAAPGDTVYVARNKTRYAPVTIRSVGTENEPVAFVTDPGDNSQAVHALVLSSTATPALTFSGAQYVDLTGFSLSSTGTSTLVVQPRLHRRADQPQSGHGPGERGGYVDLYNAHGDVDLIADVQGYFTTKSIMGNDQMGNLAAIPPARVLDTRYGTGAAEKKVAPGSTTTVTLPKEGQTDETIGAVLNVTVTGGTGSGVVTVYCDSRPSTSNLNYRAGQTVSNLVVTKVCSGGKIEIHNSGGHVNLIADLQGLYTDYNPDGDNAPIGSPFVPAAPTRFLDTRNGTGAPAKPLGANSTLTAKVAGVGGVPDDATAVLVNLTGVGPTTPNSDEVDAMRGLLTTGRVALLASVFLAGCSAKSPHLPDYVVLFRHVTHGVRWQLDAYLSDDGLCLTVDDPRGQKSAETGCPGAAASTAALRAAAGQADRSPATYTASSCTDRSRTTPPRSEWQATPKSRRSRSPTAAACRPPATGSSSNHRDGRARPTERC